MATPKPAPTDARTAPANVRVYDPALCCSTGVCGPDVDPELIRFAADLDWLKREGVEVERFNLAQQPGAFTAEPTVRRILQDTGEAGLPLILVGGVVKSSGTYPSRDMLAAWSGLVVADSLWDEKVAELAAIAASVAASCVSCLSAHEQRARTLGIPATDVRRAVETGRAVREASIARIEQHAERLLEGKRTSLPVSSSPRSCC
jgi:AhpD family alkylhydroperoxidase